jgi:HSP20 family protein
MSKATSPLHYVKRHQAPGDSETHWAPNTDVYVTETGLVIKVELAGMRKEDLQLVIEGNKVKINGHRPDGCRAPKCKFLVMEINYGAFETIIELPEGYSLSRAKAAYQNGFLRIDVPLASDEQPPRLRVDSAAS